MIRNPERLIGENGRPVYGVRSRPIEDLNIGDFRFYGQEKTSKFKNRILKDFLRKRWQYMGVCSPQVIFGAAVVHLGYMSNIFVYGFDRTDGKLREFGTNQPLAANTVFEGSSVNGRAAFQSPGVSVAMENGPEAVRLSVRVKKNLSADLVFRHAVEPLPVVTRVGLRQFNYTHKEAGLPVEGSIRLGDKVFAVNPDKPAGIMDYTFGYLARNTFWNWASGAGTDKGGRRIGFNLVQGVNDTGFTENAFWVNGRLIKTDVIDFEYDDRNILSPWRIRSNDGKVNLTFRPEGERKADINLGVIASRFHQPFGTFEGTLRDGLWTLKLADVSGFCEEHESLW